jgi:hypothetical protein
MSFASIRTSVLIFVVLALSGGAGAQPYRSPRSDSKILTMTLDGTLGPVISGSDPANLDGESATVTVTASESLKPYKTSSKSASYHIPAGDIVVDVNGTDYTSTSRSEMIVKLSSKADLLAFKATLEIDDFTVKVSSTSALASGSWTNSVLEHPAPFSPSPQDLSSPSSTFTYTVFGETTVLGVTGTASSSDAAPRQ